MQRRSLLAGALTFIGGAALARAGGVPSTRPPVPRPGRRSQRITLVGDCLFTQGLARGDSKLQRLLPFLRDADVTVANLEGTLADAATWASVIDPDGIPICGGLNVRGEDSVPSDLAWLGIDMVGTANNHAMDWGPDGLLATTRKLTAAGIQHSGSGADLSQARKPAYYDGPGGRTALIACTSTYWPGALASHGNADIPGRPGVNPVRFRTDGNITVVDPRDLAEICAAVTDARAAADIVLVSCHTHEDSGDRLIPPAFLTQLAHACVDAGTHGFFSHGPHVLRGIEMYRNAPIFYSLGAFIFRARNTQPLPEELYENCGMTGRDPLEFFAKTSRGWDEDAQFWQSVIARLEVDQGRVTAVNLIPTAIQHDAAQTYGLPELAEGVRGQEILARMQKLSASFGTVLDIDGGVGKVRL